MSNGAAEAGSGCWDKIIGGVDPSSNKIVPGIKEGTTLGGDKRWSPMGGGSERGIKRTKGS